MTEKTTTVSYYFEHYLLECEYVKGLRPKTMKSYQDVFKNFSNLMPEVKSIEDLQPFTIHEFFKRLAIRAKNNKKSLKTSSIRTYYNKLIAFIKWLENRQLIREKFSHKLIKPPNPTYQDEKALKKEDISAIISSINLHTVDNVFMQRRDLVMIYLLLYTGIRRGELLGLRIQDVDFQAKTLFVFGGTSKSKKSRYIPLHFTVLTHLKSYFKERKKRDLKSLYLIVSTQKDKALSDHGLKHWVAKYNRLSGIKFHLHQFRHTFACSLAKSNADIINIKNVLGHSSTRMTEHYLRSIKTENARLFINDIQY